MTTKQQLFCAWCGPLFMATFGLGFMGFARFIPPLSPALDMTQVVTYYQTNAVRIQAGMCVAMMGTAFLMPWVALISQQMLRIKGSSSIWAATQLGAGIVGIMLIILPCLLWIAATFRPERNPELVYFMHDTAWIIFVLPSPMALTQSVALGIAILSDHSQTPVCPRWAGFLNLWIALMFIPAPLAAFFLSGPFAWNGLFPFWIPLVGFSSWFIIMFVLLLKAIKQEAQ